MKRTPFTHSWRFARQGELPAAVTVPHDAMLAAPRHPQNPSGGAQAHFAGGRYVYEAAFTAPAHFAQRHYLLEFEGVYKNARVLVNGCPAGGAAHGYLPFFVELDPFLKQGENTIRVECDNAAQPDSRWYTGAGLLRPVWLWEGPKACIPPRGLRVKTVGLDPARVQVTTQAPRLAEATVTVELLDGDTVVAAGSGADVTLTLPRARLWSDSTPHLYICRVRAGQDTAETTFGVRRITWDSCGLYVNGAPTLLRGGCLHPAGSVLGGAEWDDDVLRRVRKLKAAGFNALRSVGVPCSRALLDACDAEGVYVIDECWDTWFLHKTLHDYAGQWRRYYPQDLQALVDRDYNHPSVLLYSIGSELAELARPDGLDAARKLVALLHRADDTRPVTGAFHLPQLAARAPQAPADPLPTEPLAPMHSGLFNLVVRTVANGLDRAANTARADAADSPVLDVVDIVGYNYANSRYPAEGHRHPGRLIFGAETLPQNSAKNWAMVERYRYLIGDFMWTAWDHMGQAGAGAWGYTPDSTTFARPYPWLLAGAGALDLLGNENANLFLAQAAWGRLSAPVIAVQPPDHPGVRPAKAVWRVSNGIPCWSWSGCEGNKTTVEVYAGKPAACVRLLLNGRLLGQKPVKECKASFTVRYAPGRLQAVALDAAGNEWARSELHSATGKISATLTPESTAVPPGGLVHIAVTLQGENGIGEAGVDRTLTAQAQGGVLLGFGSAQPRTPQSFLTGRYTTWHGRALAVVRAGQGSTVTLTVQDGGEQTSVTIPIQKP